jgi:hypothetical protein
MAFATIVSFPAVSSAILKDKTKMHFFFFFFLRVDTAKCENGVKLEEAQQGKSERP